MATTTNVLVGIGERVVYRQMGDHMGILVSSFSRPRCIMPGNRGFYLGLHDRTWFQNAPRASGTATYYVRIVPVWNGISDVNGMPLMGTPTIQSALGTTFAFDPFPDGYACDGYRVWAGTTTGVLYYQGPLDNVAVVDGVPRIDGRFNTVFTIGSTWAYNTNGATLLEQLIGPPAFADCVEVFESEGAVDSRIFLGGGQVYGTGYARIAKATSGPSLTCGTVGNTTAGTWAAITDASFRMMLGWPNGSVDYEQIFDFDGITFAGSASMADVAAVFQAAIRAARHPALYGGTAPTTTIATWTAISDGSFDVWVDGVLSHVTACNFTGATTMANMATQIQTRMQAAGGNLAAATCSWNTTAGRFVVKANNGSATEARLLSYLFPHTTGVGTNISGMMACNETSTGVMLARRGKSATTAESVAYSTDHFAFTDSNAGQQYRMGYLQQAAIGTDVSTASWANGRETGTGSLYTPGLTAGYSVQGNGTAWGDWAEGMRLRFAGDTSEFLLGHIYGPELASLETGYSGPAFGPAWTQYTFMPYNQQVYISELRNPFYFNPDSIIQTPVEDGDGITALRRCAQYVYACMQNHLWLFDGVSITNPKMVSANLGVPNSQVCVEFGPVLMAFTGHDFIALSGGVPTRIDAEDRMKAYIARLSPAFTDYHGVYCDSEGRSLIIWFVALDGGFTANTAFVYEPKTGMWWTYNVKDALSSAMIKDNAGNRWLVTGDSYDPGHAVKAWIQLWSKDYHADATYDPSSYTTEGKINTVGASTTTAGKLTCGTPGATLAQFQGVTAGYFSLTVDDSPYDVGPVDLSGASALAGVATLLQTALRAATGGTETVAYAGGVFVFTSGTTTARSVVLYLRPYLPVASATDLSDKPYLNGRAGHATITYAVSTMLLTLDNWSAAAAAMYAASDGEMGVWIYLCDANYRSGQYVRVVSNSATQVTVTPVPSTTPVAGWLWFLGGIVPTWTKWFDFGAAQHKHKIHGIAVTVRPGETADGNVMAVHGMQDLDSTIRTTCTMQLGSGADTVQTVFPQDKHSTQHGVQLLRPSTQHGLGIDDVTIAHRAKV